MLVIDVNVLVALHRDDQEAHVAAARWWQTALGAGETVTAPDLVTAGFVR